MDFVDYRAKYGRVLGTYIKFWSDAWHRRYGLKRWQVFGPISNAYIAYQLLMEPVVEFPLSDPETGEPVIYRSEPRQKRP